jgi:hypothetical protein
MVLEDAKQKELGVVWMMEVLRVRVEAEAEVDLVERLAVKIFLSVNRGELI